MIEGKTTASCAAILSSQKNVEKLPADLSHTFKVIYPRKFDCLYRVPRLVRQVWQGSKQELSLRLS